MSNRYRCLALVLVLAFVAGSGYAGPIIGGFDAARGGRGALTTGYGFAEARGWIAGAYPAAELREANVLTAGYLSDLDVLCISPVRGSVGATPLSAAEQAAVVSFVAAGGGALLVTDHCQSPNKFALASRSFVDPFGVSTTGFYNSGSATVTVTNPSHPVADGPFGTAAAGHFSYAGWYDDLGSDAVEVGTLPNAGIGIAAISPGQLAPTAGGVVCFSDDFIGLSSGNDNRVLFLNALAFVMSEPQGGDAIPEPTTIGLLALGGLGLLRRRRER